MIFIGDLDMDENGAAEGGRPKDRATRKPRRAKKKKAGLGVVAL